MGMPPADDPAHRPGNGAHDPTTDVMRRCRHCGAPLAPTATFCSKCGGSAPLTEGAADLLREQVQTLFGRDLEIERELGRGGMAAVYAAFDPTLQRRVAVKVLLPEIANDAESADRFLREARTVAALQHPHVVAVHAVRSGNGVHAIVLQFVEGRSLDVVLAERGRLSVPLAGLLLAESANGLQHAHERGVVHRDVKPANVLIDRDGRAVVSDFGIARREDAPRITGTGLVIGTWAYMSPEQRFGEVVTPATDQYALGVMAFELLAGRLPFMGSPTEMLHAHLNDPMPSLRALRPEVPEVVEAAVRRMMAKVPADRWPSLKDVERVFRKLVADEGKTTLQMAALTVPVPRGGSSTIVSAVTATDLRTAKTEQLSPEPAPTRVPAAVAPTAVAPAASASRAWIPMAVAFTLALAALGSWAVRSRQHPSTASAPAAAPAATSSAPPDATPPGAAVSAATIPATPTRAPMTQQPTGAAGAAAPTVPIVAPASASPVASASTVTPEKQRTVESVRAEPEPAPAKAFPASSVADARRLGREFVTLLNQRRFRDIALWPAVGGSPGLRSELLKLTESAPEFAAGFDRIPAAPDEWTNGFQTEFYLDLEWRGGRKILRIRLYASPSDAGWRTAGFAVDEP